MSGDPGAILEASEQRAVQLARGAIIDVFHAGAAFAHFGSPQPRPRAELRQKAPRAASQTTRWGTTSHGCPVCLY